MKKTKSLRLGIGEDEKVANGWVTSRLASMDSFTYLGSIISKDGGSSEDVKVE